MTTVNNAKYSVEEERNGYGETRFYIYEKKRGVGDGFYWDQVKTTKPDFAKKIGEDPSNEYPVVFTTQEKAFFYVNQLLKSEFTVTGRWFFGEE